jgi:soluble lytic murein transglycosylase
MKQEMSNRPPNRGISPSLSSTLRRFAVAILLASAAGSTTPVFAQSIADLEAAKTAPSNAAEAAALNPVPVRPATVQPIRADDNMASAVSYWRMLQQADNYSFSSYANFMMLYPGWPGEGTMRKNAERMMRADVESASQVVSFFTRYPAISASAQLRHAEALASLGRKQESLAAARMAWTKGALTPEDESRFLNRFAGALQAGDHDRRMDRLLWDRSTMAAARQLPWTSAERRAQFDARLAMLTKAPDAATKSAAVYAVGRNDAGYLADRSWWLRNSGQLPGSRDLLAAPRQLVAPPVDPDRWLEAMLITAKAANTDYQYSHVYNIARQANDAYPAGTVVSDRPFSERDKFTDLVWLGGQTALTKIGRPADAISLFLAYADAAKSAQTKAKGLYWAGRAADAAGQRSQASGYYQSAGQYFDQFHGQLALERLRQPIAPPNIRRTVEISGSQRDAFEGSSLVKAAKYLGAQGDWMEQSKFIRTIAGNVNNDAQAVMANELAFKINRPDLAVMVGRQARSAGLGDYLKSAFPQLNVPSQHTNSWTMIHAITRQESQFDRQIISRAGARGLMQLMPGTARETAPRAGLSYSLPRLFESEYNIMLGSTYFGQLMDRYGGNYVLSVAAYNAGPGNVNRWLSSNGDPRVPGSDVLAWIEKIPLSETRNYVQRVLENAVVYDMLNPGRANIRSATPLSAYLGKSQPG